jgi:hypothetical protein
MVWVEPREITVEGELPPEYPTVQRADDLQPAKIVDCMPNQTTMEITAQNIKVLELCMSKYLENRGLSKTQVAAYISDVSMNARQFKFRLDVQPPFFLTLHLPEQWKIKGATVNGEAADLFLYDSSLNSVFIGMLGSSSTVDVVLQLEPLLESGVGLIASFAVTLIVIALVKSLVKKLMKRF